MRARSGRLSRDAVDATRLEARLMPPIDGPVEWRTEVDSTNDALADAARAGAPEGSVLGADHQTAGKGRLGRTWEDAPGQALAISALLRPPDALARHAGALPIAAATAVAEALGESAQVAWPNDVLLDARKVAGILLEAAWEGPVLAWVVVGMGINVTGVPDVPPGTWPAGALAEIGSGPDREEVAGSVLRALALRYRSLIDDGPSAMVRAFTPRDALAGRVVRVHAAGSLTEGSADGVGEDGALRLRTPAGVESFASADRLEVLAPAS